MSSEQPPPSQRSNVPTALPIAQTPTKTAEEGGEEKSTQKSSDEEKNSKKEKEKSTTVPVSARIPRATSKGGQSTKSAAIHVKSHEQVGGDSRKDGSKTKKKKKTSKSSRKGVDDEEMPKTADSDKEDEAKKKKALKKRLSASPTKEKEAKQTDVVPLNETASKTTTTTTLAKKESHDVMAANGDEKAKQGRGVRKRETNHIFHVRPRVSKKVEFLRNKLYEEELKLFETGDYTYLTDPSRYRFRSTPPLELVIQLVFPSLLLLAIMLSCLACSTFLSQTHESAGVITEMNEMTLVKYDSFMVVDSIDRFLRDVKRLKYMNCPGLVQSPYRPLEEHEVHILNYERTRVRKAVKANTYRWMYLIDPVIQMNFECPPSVLIEMKKQ